MEEADYIESAVNSVLDDGCRIADIIGNSAAESLTCTEMTQSGCFFAAYLFCHPFQNKKNCPGLYQILSMIMVPWAGFDTKMVVEDKNKLNDCQSCI